MQLEICSVNYCVPVTSRQYGIIDRREFSGVETLMENAGASKVDWNGHFGLFIFFTSSAEDAPNVLEVVKKLCK